MTSIAWAAMFIALIFYQEIYQERLAGYGNVIGGFTIFCFAVLMLCSGREMLR